MLSYDVRQRCVGERLKDSQAARNAWFGISCFKPLSPFSLMKYCTMLGSRGSQQTMKPQKRGPRLQKKKEKSTGYETFFLMMLLRLSPR